jgi:hypothetical protein
MSMERMNADRLSWLGAAARWPLAGRVSLVAACLGGAFILVLPAAWFASGGDGPIAAALAAAVCLFASAGGMAIGDVLADRRHAMYRVVMGTVVRMAVPLVMGTAVYSGGHRLADAGFVFYLIGFYLAMLAVDACLASLRPLGEHADSIGRCAANAPPAPAEALRKPAARGSAGRIGSAERNSAKA